MVIFVSIEGIDGTGKTTLMQGLERVYENDNSIVLTREPYDQNIKDKYRITSPDMAAYIFAMDRYAHIETLNQMCENDTGVEMIITDRYYHSSFAYQAFDGVPIWWNERIQPRNLIIPNLCILLTCEPTLAATRGGETDAARLKAIQNIYKSVFQYPAPSPMVEIDTTHKSVGEVLGEVMKIISDFRLVMSDEIKEV